MTEPWLDHALEPAAQEWIVTELAAAGRRIGPGTDQPRIRPWSTVLRIATDDGSVWFKANGPGTTYEPWLMSALADWAPGRVLEPLATDPDRGWSLLPDGGPILRSLPDDEVLARWERILPEYAQFQQGIVGRVDDMVRHGVPDDRPAHMPGRLAALLGDPEVLLVGQPAGLTHDQLRDLHALEDRYVGWCARLDAADIPPTRPPPRRLPRAVGRRWEPDRPGRGPPAGDQGSQGRTRSVLEPGAVVGAAGRAGEYGDAVPGWLLELFEPDLV